MPYQVRGVRPGATFMTIACTRSAIARSESDISAILASTTSSPSVSFSVAFNAARSSVVSFLLIASLSFRSRRRPGQDRRNVLEQLDATVEGAAADHLESNIRIVVVDPLPAGPSGDD